MGRLVNLARGYVELKASGAFPERLLNLCAQERARFWRLQWIDETSFVFRVYYQDLDRVKKLADRAMCSLTERSRGGGGVAAVNLMRRWGFVAGLTLCLLAAAVLSRFIWVIEVTGNETVSTAAILSQLRRVGVRPGAYGPAIPQREAANDALLGLPGLSYLAINVYGTRAEVIVREADEPPEVVDESVPADIVAAADGIIEEIQPESGRALFAAGDVVARGEVLITGDMELLPTGSLEPTGRMLVRAAGLVRARTWRTLEETVPLTAQVKEYTGEEVRRYALEVLGGRWEIFKNSSISDTRYDKITETAPVTLFGAALPARTEVTTLRGYTLKEEPIDQEAAEEELRQLLLDRLDRLMAAGHGEVLRTDLLTRVEGGRLTVTLLAECREDIGRTAELPGETGRREYAAPSPDGAE